MDIRVWKTVVRMIMEKHYVWLFGNNMIYFIPGDLSPCDIIVLLLISTFRFGRYQAIFIHSEGP